MMVSLTVDDATMPMPPSMFEYICTGSEKMSYSEFSYDSEEVM